MPCILPKEKPDSVILASHKQKNISMSVLLETSYGDIVVDLFDKAPTESLNFLKLCKLKYYNDCEFFRIEKGFVAQTGDPDNTGKGGMSIFSKTKGPEHTFFSSDFSMMRDHRRKGTISMTSASETSEDDARKHGSQFFITLADGLDYLDSKHTPFGQVEEGMDVVDRIANAFVDEEKRPFRAIRIRHTIILHDPFDDPVGMPAECPSPEPIQGGPGDRLASDEDDNDGEEDDVEKLKRLKEQEEDLEAQSRAEVLEMIGDIGDASMKPPENVLFICKLNPVTEAEDLEIIFSRFGECKADIIVDKESGDSLCYGFIEFETKEQCERAYFKMDNSLIDDRRVRVDFSQSVSKLWRAAQKAKLQKGRTEPAKRRKLG